MLAARAAFKAPGAANASTTLVSAIVSGPCASATAVTRAVASLAPSSFSLSAAPHVRSIASVAAMEGPATAPSVKAEVLTKSALRTAAPSQAVFRSFSTDANKPAGDRISMPFGKAPDAGAGSASKKSTQGDREEGDEGDAHKVAQQLLSESSMPEEDIAALMGTSSSENSDSRRRLAALEPSFKWNASEAQAVEQQQAERRAKAEERRAARAAEPAASSSDDSTVRPPPHPASVLPLPPVKGSAPAPKLPPQRPGLSAGILQQLDAIEDKRATLAAGHNIYAGKAAALNEGASAVPRFDPEASAVAAAAGGGFKAAANPFQAMSAGAAFGIDSLERVGEAVNFSVGKEGRMAIASAIYRRLRQQKQRRLGTLQQLLRASVAQRAGVSRLTGERLTRAQSDALAAYLLSVHVKGDIKGAALAVDPAMLNRATEKASMPPLVPTVPLSAAAIVHGLKSEAASRVVPLKAAFEGSESSAAINTALWEARQREYQTIQQERWQQKQQARLDRAAASANANATAATE